MGWYGDENIYVGNVNPLPLGVQNLNPNGLKFGTKNGRGEQYSGGDVLINNVFMNYTIKNTGSEIIYGGNTTSMYEKLHIDMSNKAPICIILLPKNAFPYTNSNYGDTYSKSIQAGNMDENVYSSFCVLGFNTGTTRLRYTRDKSPKSYYGSTYSRSYAFYNGTVAPDSEVSVLQDDVTQGYYDESWAIRLSSFPAELARVDTTYKRRFWPIETEEAITEQLSLLEQKYDDWDVFKNALVLSTQPVFTFIGASTFGSNAFIQSQRIAASVPIFDWKDWDAIYRYFKNGELDPINKDDLKMSDVGIATDWTIYVNGQRSPDITVTMNSKNIDAYLENKEENTGGYVKSDFKVEYKAPTFKLNEWTDLLPKPTGETVNVDESVYDSSLFSSWDAITDINFINKKTALPSNIENFAQVYALYAQLQFRIWLNDTIFSSWCEFGIGYIGTPTVEDFSLMENYGRVMESVLDDGSTVTIIYDQLPPDEDDYEDPPDDFPDEGDTAPSGYDLTSALTQTYKTTENQLEQLGNFLWNKSFMDNIRLVNSNPIENIVGCKRIPYDVPAGVARNIVMGNVTANASGNIVSSIPIIDVGSIKYNGYYGNFLDYSPYTRLILFLPFCGFTEIDPSVITGKTMSIKYAIDVIMGKCRAMVFVDGAYYASYDGNFGVEVPLTGSNRAQVDAGLVASAVGTIASAYFSPAGTAAKVAKAAVGGLETATAAQYHSTRTGSYSSTCAWQETRKCFMIADIPTCQYPSSYGHDRGYPCMLTRTLATMHGFTVCSADVDMKGLTCTEEEMDMIKEILTTGIYL